MTKVGQYSIQSAIVLAAVALAAMRVAGFKSATFQALAHFYVGFLVGAWAGTLCDGWAVSDKACLALAVALSIVELLCFLLP